MMRKNTLSSAVWLCYCCSLLVCRQSYFLIPESLAFQANYHPHQHRSTLSPSLLSQQQPCRRRRRPLFASSSEDQQQEQKQEEQQTLLSLASSPSTSTPTNDDSSSSSSFGDVVDIRSRPSDTNGVTETMKNGAKTNGVSSSFSSPSPSMEDIAAQEQTKNFRVAVASVVLALSNYFYQYFHPVEPIQLLYTMQQSSPSLQVIGKNNKPTMVDVWAPWCENCRQLAPTLYKLEQSNALKDKVNFILVNADEKDAWTVIDKLGVDAIPHLALIDANGNVQTALIGPIPEYMIQQDLNVLIADANGGSPAVKGKQQQQQKKVPYDVAAVAVNNCVANAAELGEPCKTDTVVDKTKIDLPYTMLDVFAYRPNDRHVEF